MFRLLLSLIPPLLAGCASTPAPGEESIPSPLASLTAEQVARTQSHRAIDLLAQLVSFDTFHRDGIPNAAHPSFRAMTERLARVAEAYGLDFVDHGAVVVIGLGDSEQRLGIITHGDVQPADASKWANSPFKLDQTSEEDRLVGRGVEDDKGPIACALVAMRELKRRGIPLNKRIELIISYTEESDWAPFTAFLEANPPPALNIGFDAEYPVVVAEKGWCQVSVMIPVDTAIEASTIDSPAIASFDGGFFLSQVPEDARATLTGVDDELFDTLQARTVDLAPVTFAFERSGDALTIVAHGHAAHSSTPWEGANAITHLAELLAPVDAPTPAGRMARFIRDLVGTGWKAERFGDLAYADEFMGPLTLSLGTLGIVDGELTAGINLRRPTGRSREDVQASIDQAIQTWQAETPGLKLAHTSYVGEPHPRVDAPHVPILLDTFRAYTNSATAECISIGGGTHARLVPAGVNFGPSMPGVVYTGHSEHEFMERDQFLLNLRMLTSALVDLTAQPQ